MKRTLILLGTAALALGLGACEVPPGMHFDPPARVWLCRTPAGAQFTTESRTDLQPVTARTCRLVDNVAGVITDEGDTIVCVHDGYRFTTDVASARNAGILDECQVP